jgi:hypothetical protein
MASLTPFTTSDQASPKRMRKGTRSCVECRRRKVRCISSNYLTACNHCLYRKTECIDQERNPYSARQGVAQEKSIDQRNDHELKDLIGQLVRKLDGNVGTSSISGTDITTMQPLSVLRSELLPSTVASADVAAGLQTPASSDSSTAMSRPPGPTLLPSLFDVALLSQGGNGSSERGIQPVTEQRLQLLEEKSYRVVCALAALTDEAEDLHLALEVSPDCWKLWCQAFPHVFGDKFASCSNEQMAISIVCHIHQTLAEANIPQVAKAMFYLALSLQQIPGHIDSSRMRLGASLEVLQDQYLTSAETLITLDEGFACTLDGIECMMVQAKFYINVGKPRKAWMTFRRAGGVGHLLGLHRLPGNSIEPRHQRGIYLWQSLCLLERLLSLTLGLPSSVSQARVNAQNVAAEDLENPPAQLLMQRLSEPLKLLVDRNQDPNKFDFPTTAKIDQELEDIKNAIPQAWWDTPPRPEMSLDAIQDIFQAKFMYHNVRRHLHLPFMLEFSNEPRCIYSTTATLESSREMIKAYQVLRDKERPILTICDVLDYIVFTAAMSLIIADLRQHSPTQPSIFRPEGDWEIIRVFRDNIKRFSEERPCSVATQIVRLLDDFSRVRHEGWPDVGGGEYHVTIPYFGKVRVRKALWPETSSVKQQQPQHSHQNQLPTPNDVQTEAWGPAGTGFDLEPPPYMVFESFLQAGPGGEEQRWDDVLAGTDWGDATMSYGGDELRVDWGWLVD